MSQNNIININTLSATFTKTDYVGQETYLGNLYYHTPDNISSLVVAVNQNAETLAKACFTINEIRPADKTGNFKIEADQNISIDTGQNKIKLSCKRVSSVTNETPDLVSGSISGNVLTLSGRGITSVTNETPTLVSGSISGNVLSLSGKGITSVTNETPTLVSGSISDNVLSLSGKGITSVTNQTPEFVTGSISNNILTLSGAAQSGGGVTSVTNQTPEFVTGSISNNILTLSGAAQSGGGQSLPVGTIIARVGNADPTGYQYCNGTSASTAALQEFLKNAGYPYGIDENNQPKVPDLQDRVLQGAGTIVATNGLIEAGLPNISGTIPLGDYDTTTEEDKTNFTKYITGCFECDMSESVKGRSVLLKFHHMLIIIIQLVLMHQTIIQYMVNQIQFNQFNQLQQL